MAEQKRPWTATEIAITDYLYARCKDNTLPGYNTAPEVEWIYKNLHDTEYGVTNPMAQAIKIISDKTGENCEGGTLRFVQGRNFASRNLVYV